MFSAMILNLDALMVLVFRLKIAAMDHKIAMTNLMKLFVKWSSLTRMSIIKNLHLYQSIKIEHRSM